MPLPRETMLVIILICQIGMALLAVLFLRTRRMSLTAYITWGLLALFVPFLGPFLVILSCPGKRSLQPHKRKPRGKGIFELM